MLVAYARVSTQDQTLALQEDALRSAGCERIFTETASGAQTDRPALAEVLLFLRPGDTLVVWRLDRLGRSLHHLLDVVMALEDKGIGFNSLSENIDTTTSTGKLVFHIFGSLAEFERNLIRDRTLAGLAAARARGRKGGHPRVTAFNTPNKLALARAMHANQTTTIAEICETLHVSKTTLYRYLKEAPATQAESGKENAQP